MMNEVTVVIPSYNYGHFIEDAVSSVTRQSFPDIEILVIDNASTDNTIDIVERMRSGEPRIRLIRNAVNLGVSACRNVGIAAATGRWITFLDADDWYDSSRIQRLIEAAETTKCDLLADNQFFIDDGCATPWRTMIECEEDGLRLLDLDSFLQYDRVKVGERTTIGLIKPFIRRSVLTGSGIYYRDDLWTCEDFDFELRLLEYLGKMAFLTRPLYFYRRHPRSVTAENREGTLLGNLRVTYAALERQCGGTPSPTRERLLRRAMTLERALACNGVLASIRSRRPLAVLREVVRQPQAVMTISAGAARHLCLQARRRFARTRDMMATSRGL